MLKQGKIRLVLTSPLNSKSPINDHLRKHGDGVKVIALWVDDATSSTITVDIFCKGVDNNISTILNWI